MDELLFNFWLDGLRLKVEKSGYTLSVSSGKISLVCKRCGKTVKEHNLQKVRVFGERFDRALLWEMAQHEWDVHGNGYLLMSLQSSPP